MVSIWQLFRGGGMGGTICMPNDVMEQPRLMLGCFNIMTAMQHSLDDETADPLNEDGEVDIGEKCRREFEKLTGMKKK